MNGPRTLAVDFDVYEVAYLAGGPRRAVDAAMVALVEGGRVAVDRTTGQLAVADGGRRHPVEAAVLDAIGVRHHRTIATVRWRVETDERLSAVRRRLEGDGLLRPSAPSSRRYSAWSLMALTAEGRRTLRHLRAEPPADRIALGTGALPVALGGPAAMTDPALRSALFDPPAPPRPRSVFRRRRDPYDAAYDHRGHWWGAGAVGGADCGGGGWGGDGGGGGGGDGGGGC
ncbi:TIGR04222 domain-containing membrane protein [Blastococcus sp. CT_GayMR20]|uniref:TIGR04222 domain-containing membrane protein n=1 Tax=Blastococcus sp. CT_GayMR20 TaxID=2559609 RepID=UPI0010748561|nr:TIGR04222 domain-containing membrane protein [Blastococcus sp. CT_GayMR20]TFV71653.1 TIGR04222 domain-containing membrane protein [Blastococcus sp. CT_GayMR20]